MATVTFETEDGLRLEGEIRAPDGPARGTAVLCHPHPEHGGSKDHPLLWAIRNELAGRQGLSVLSFNFRGIMGSEGEHAGGAEETRDARAAVDRVRREAEGPTVMVGWSFGANVALRHAVGDDRVAALVLVGLPLGDLPVATVPVPDDEALRSLHTPVLLLAGDHDPFSPVPLLLELAGRIPNADVRVVDGGGHFFPGMEREAARVVGEFVHEALG